MANLLLHSLAEFDEVIFQILSRMAPHAILEIGSETGIFTRRLLDYCAETGARLITIDPGPAPELAVLAAARDDFDLVAGTSLAYLEEHGCPADLVLIDGDHNYHTVSNELRLIHESWTERGTAGAILLHDVGFPCARRDAYYEPRHIPEPARQPFSYERGVTLDSPTLIEGGFRGMGRFAWAALAGGERNGVLTAIEDFRDQHPGYAYRAIDAVFGLGALTLPGSVADEAVADAMAPYDNQLIRRLERNRLELYLKVLKLQGLLAARKARDPLGCGR